MRQIESSRSETILWFFHVLKKKITLLGPCNPENKTRARRVSPADEGAAELSLLGVRSGCHWSSLIHYWNHASYDTMISCPCVWGGDTHACTHTHTTLIQIVPSEKCALVSLGCTDIQPRSLLMTVLLWSWALSQHFLLVSEPSNNPLDGCDKRRKTNLFQ